MVNEKKDGKESIIFFLFLTLTFLFLLVISSLNVQAKLVASYAFNETNGSIVLDNSSNENNGVLSGATRTASGKYGRALSFNGQNNMVNISDSDSLDLTNEMTLEAWVYPTTVPRGWRPIIVKEFLVDLSYSLYASSKPGNKPVQQVNVGGERTLQALSQLPTNTWTFIVATYDGEVQRIYINGVEAANRNQSGIINASTGFLRFGGYPLYKEFFAGRIDEIRIYNNSLTPLEIISDMNTPVGNIPVDIIPPSVSITFPLDSADVSGTVSVTADASDNIGVVGVQFLLDGNNLSNEDTTSPYSVDWDSDSASNGIHIISARARDAVENIATAVNISVNVLGVDAIPPVVLVTNNPVNPTDADLVTVNANATDASGVKQIDIYVDDLLVQSCFSDTCSTTPQTYSVGAHSYYTISVDNSPNNNTARSPVNGSYGFNVILFETESPQVAVDSQVDNDVVSGIVSVNVTASDNIGVVGVQFLLDGNNLEAEDTTNPYSILWNSGLTTNGVHVLSAKARDAVGNIGLANNINVYVNNSGFVYPLKASSNGRYLVDQNNVPFMMMGDSPQTLVALASEADADMYFANRQANGFNAAWVNLLCIKDLFCNSAGTTYDGIAPFTTPDDLSTPNEAYFTRVDHMIQYAANHGIVVVLDPIETISWLSTLRSNGINKSRAYGQYLGNRYKNYDNIIWMSGNDFQTWSNPSDDAVVKAVALGIKDNDTRHLQTIELNYLVSSSIDDPVWASFVDLNAAYTYYATYAELLKDYNNSSIPTFMVEANYELESLRGYLTTPYILRKQEYWTMLSGATGQLYGSAYTDSFQSGWQTHLDLPGSLQIKYLNSLFLPRQWYNLVPDQGHSIVTAGYGTYDSLGTVLENDYLTAASLPDGSLVMAYMPTIRAITVNMSKLVGSTTARWYDPSSGTYTTVAGSPFPNTGTRQFTPVGNNTDGDGDWVLVLESTPGPVILDSLDVINSGTGSGVITGTGISCGTDCAEIVTNGSVVTLTASPASNSTFAGWSGACSGTDVCSFVINGNVSVIGTFDIIPESVPSITTQPVSQTVFVGSNATFSVLASGNPSPSYQWQKNGLNITGAISSSYTTPATIDSDNGSIYQVIVYNSIGGVISNPAILNVNVIPSGLVGYWKLDDGNGTTASDSSGNSNTGVLLSGPTWTVGNVSGALSFDGINDNVNITDSPSLRLSSSFTLAGWINAAGLSGGYKTILNKESGPGDCKYYLQTVGTEVSAGFNDGTGCKEHLSSGANLQINKWYHIAAVFDDTANTFKIYVNGVQKLSESETRVETSSNGIPLVIGKTFWGEYWNGKLDEVRVYNKALSASEVQQLYVG